MPFHFRSASVISIIISLSHMLLSFPSTKTCLRLSVFLKIKNRIKEVKAIYFTRRTKVPFMEPLVRLQEPPQKRANVGFLHHPLSAFSDLKINKRQVQRRSGKAQRKPAAPGLSKFNLHLPLSACCQETTGFRPMCAKTDMVLG